MTKVHELFGVKSFVVVTGASRGYGRALAVQLGKVLHPSSTLLLMARDQADLEVTKSLVLEVASAGLLVVLEPVDLATADEADFTRIMEAHAGQKDHVVAMVIHNAGTIGQDGRKVTEMTDMSELALYYRLNLFHVVCLNSVFTKFFPSTFKVYINISSILALQPLKTWANYCGGKAARDAVFRVLAMEKPEALVLSYAPGPLDTPLVDNLIKDPRTDADIRTSFVELLESGAILQPEVSAAALVALLRKQNFSSGDHVDYYDPPVAAAVADFN